MDGLNEDVQVSFFLHPLQGVCMQMWMAGAWRRPVLAALVVDIHVVAAMAAAVVVGMTVVIGMIEAEVEVEVAQITVKGMTGGSMGGKETTIVGMIGAAMIAAVVVAAAVAGRGMVTVTATVTVITEAEPWHAGACHSLKGANEYDDHIRSGKDAR